jgi:hypothetical protein
MIEESMAMRQFLRGSSNLQGSVDTTIANLSSRHHPLFVTTLLLTTTASSPTLWFFFVELP